MPSLCRNALAWGALWAGLNLTNPALLEAADPGWTPIGDVGSANVWWPYQVQTYEFTNAEYTAFLNAIDPQGINPNDVYNVEMGTSTYGGITFNNGSPNGSKYTVKTSMGARPVNYVNFLDAARVANWMHNGSKSYTTSDASAAAPQNYGSYAVGAGTTFFGGHAIWSRFWIPSLNEWRKAAWYKGGDNAGFWGYATQSNTLPDAVLATATGDGTLDGTTPVTSGNYASFLPPINLPYSARIPKNVGTNGGPSYYGTYDMTGNIAEWTEGSSYLKDTIVGGSWADMSIQTNQQWDVHRTTENRAYGFRLTREIYDSDAVWTGAAEDGLWSNPNNWFGGTVPTTSNTKMWIKDQHFGSKVTIDEATHATLECNIIGPDWGADLDIIGGSLTQIAPKGWLLFAGSVDAANRAEINISEGGRLQAHNLCLGDSWWGGYAPNVTLTIDDPESLITVTDGLWVGGHFNALDGTIDVTGEILVGRNANSYGMDKTLLNLEKATIIVRGKDVSSLVPGWVSNGWLTAYNGQGQLIVDTDTIPGGTILTAVLPVPEPSSTSLLAAAAGLLATFRLWSRGRNVKRPQ